MRKLKTSDIPAFCRCLKSIGIKDEIQKIAKDSNTAKDAWDKGFNLIYRAFDLITEKSGEKYLYEFLAGPFEMTAKEVENLDMQEFIEDCKILAKENDLTGFFKFAAETTISR